ncbi:MAG: NAD-dependent epimerase/dehydratase family protein [Actinobacteria bacterium]|nr:NAD-dependent epimerase/dehydratase family protein [Actinomycetota bacterium]
MSPAPAHRVLITGGAGFVGATLALALAERHRDWDVVALDNLKRRGSELNLPRLRAAGVHFVHGDVREPADLQALDPCQAIVECSAEPSALAGRDGATDYALRANLVGAWHCLELARRHDAQLVFLSTSRVYPVAALNRLAFEETATRFELLPEQPLAGASPRGIAEHFPLDGARTLYGTTKLAAELLVAEYRDAFGVRAAIDRCGVIAGPWQMGKVDQGVFTHWMLAHLLGGELSYIGYGGSGKQVRDLLHVEDLVDLVERQLCEPERWDGVTANVGGGRDCSLSLLETTALCREISGRELPVGPAGAERPGDVPLYVSDCSRLFGLTDWRPRRGAREVLEDVAAWIRANAEAVRAALGTS